MPLGNRNITVWLTQDVQISEYVTRAKKHTVCETPAIKTLVMNYSKFIEYKVKMYNICSPFTILKFQSKYKPCFIRSLHQVFFQCAWFDFFSLKCSFVDTHCTWSSLKCEAAFTCYLYQSECLTSTNKGERGQLSKLLQETKVHVSRLRSLGGMS